MAPRALVLGLALAGCASAETCPSYLTDCGGLCLDTASDRHNCGACGVSCADGELCEDGACVLGCGESMVPCLGVCRDLMSDDRNCGSCGSVCAEGFVCVGGSCVVGCPEGYEECSGVCRNLLGDPSHCGACDSPCSPGEVCMSGSCTFECPAPYVECSGSCADLDTDEGHCGSCTTACDPGEVCLSGACTLSCYEGLTMCSGACVDLLRDAENCGSCARPCATGSVCYEGSCTAACPGGFTDCSGSCRDLGSDRLDCGACGNACASGEVCESGACTVTCASPLVACAGTCVDTSSDPANCGSCGSPCSPGDACVLGSCEPLAIGVTTSCRAIRDAGWSIGDGTYLIDADGTGPDAPFSVYCDMTTDGGGWTLTYKIRSNVPSSLNPWWDLVMPGSGTTFPTTMAVPSGYTEGPTSATRAGLTSDTGATEWLVEVLDSTGTMLFAMRSSYSGSGGQGFRCFAAGTCTSATQTCSSAITDGHVILSTLTGPITAGGTGYVCDVGWTGCSFCVDWSSVRTDSTAGGSTSNAVLYVGDDSISLTSTTAYYFIR